eukprot:TRINITY_DN11678_c0_g1_i1.p1 TRINITY_DN11678_c0_g1~~TRINITY_DN11678_c0_g1_i1.p1  ORF type:complete len:431 (-),score=58.68 TRINITY_DN11678_c0_g1_i1:57-1349(-)
METLFELLQVTGFAAATVLLGRVFDIFHSKMIGEIIAGMLLGPQLADIVPHTDAVILIGMLGLILMVFEGGLNVDIKSLQKTGIRALVVAVCGTITPVLFGFGLMYLLGFSMLESIVSGTVLSSTSIGMATKLLQKEKQLKTKVGALLLNAAMIDDVLSLILLGVLTNIADINSENDSNSTNTTATNTSNLANTTGTDDTNVTGLELFIIIIIPLAASLGVIIVGLVCTVVFPKIEAKLRKSISRKRLRIYIVMAMLTFNSLFSISSGYIGSTFLLGSFMSGLAFSRMKYSLRSWNKYIQRSSDVLSSIFFTSIGFYIPITKLFESKAFGYGMLYTLPAIFGKLFTGVFSFNPKENALIIGSAMVGRGELGFVMSIDALNAGIFTELSLAICCWALIIPTFISPFLFRFLLKRKEKGAVKTQELPEIDDS